MKHLAVWIFAISQNCFAQIANINTCLETSLHRIDIPTNPYSNGSNYPYNTPSLAQSFNHSQGNLKGSTITPFRFYLSSPFSGTDLFESSLSYIPRKNTRLHTSFNGSPDYATASLSIDQSLQINTQWKLAVVLGGYSQWGNSHRAPSQNGQNSASSLPLFGGFQGQIFSDYRLNSQMRLSVSLDFNRIFLENSNSLSPIFHYSASDSLQERSRWFNGHTISFTKKWTTLKDAHTSLKSPGYSGNPKSVNGITTQLLWMQQSNFQFFEVLGFVPLDSNWTLLLSLRNDYNRWGLGIYRELKNGSIWGVSTRYHRDLQTFNAAIHGCF